VQWMPAFQVGIKERNTRKMELWISVDDLLSRPRPEAGGHLGLSTVSGGLGFGVWAVSFFCKLFETEGE
jgi:hypothetical protein